MQSNHPHPVASCGCPLMDVLLPLVNGVGAMAIDKCRLQFQVWHHTILADCKQKRIQWGQTSQHRGLCRWLRNLLPNNCIPKDIRPKAHTHRPNTDLQRQHRKQTQHPE